MSERVRALITAEQLDPPTRVHAVMETIRQRHPDRVLGFIYYGSSLRELDDPNKMLDFYVLVDSYRKTHGWSWRALTNWLIPPAVYYLEPNTDDVLSTCKYSIISLKGFEKRCAHGFLSQIWGRFSQPCALLGSRDTDVKDRIIAARVNAIKKLASETAPLFKTSASSTEFWGRAFFESYRTELRPESDDGRAKEIVARYAERYETLSAALFSQASDHTFTVHEFDGTGSKLKWALRRWLGRPIAAIRILNSAATFDGGLDYVLRKIERHSGVTIEVSNSQRRHPVLWSPVLGWKLWRKGAFSR